MHAKLCAFVVGLFSLLCSSLPAANLQVDITPTAAVSAGAQWRANGGAWRNSGVTVKYIPDGTCTVTFKALNGWITPAPQTVYLPGPTVFLTATYVRPP